jgi:hypothetical protein
VVSDVMVDILNMLGDTGKILVFALVACIKILNIANLISCLLVIIMLMDLMELVRKLWKLLIVKEIAMMVIKKLIRLR